MTCHNGFVRKKSQTRRQHKPRKQGVQTSSKEISVTDNDARQGHDPMTAFHEFATPADIASMRQAASRALSKGRVAAIGMVSSIYSAECARPDGACRAHPHAPARALFSYPRAVSAHHFVGVSQSPNSRARYPGGTPIGLGASYADRASRPSAAGASYLRMEATEARAEISANTSSLAKLKSLCKRVKLGQAEMSGGTSSSGSRPPKL